MDSRDFLILIGGALVVLFIGLGAGFFLQRKMTAERSRLAEQKAREAVEEAKREAEAVRKGAEIQAKDHFFKARTEFEQEAKERRQELLNMEKRLLHLAFLVHVGVVNEKAGYYDLDEKTIETYARVQFEGTRPTFESKTEKTEDARKVLKNYLNADGTLKQIPSPGSKLRIILNFIVDAFAYDTDYTEKEVNSILRRFHVDTAALRRYLVDNGLMARESDGTRYWRVRKDEE